MVNAEKKDLESRLFIVDQATYGKEYGKHLLEQYKLCVAMADKVSSRRSRANNFFLSINTFLMTAIGILARVQAGFTEFSSWWVVISACAGILFCLCWFTCIRRYRELNEAKFKVINSIEKKLPVAAFKVEWEYLAPENKNLKYPHLTRVERWVPVVFGALYLVLMIIALFLAN